MTKEEIEKAAENYIDNNHEIGGYVNTGDVFDAFIKGAELTQHKEESRDMRNNIEVFKHKHNQLKKIDLPKKEVDLEELKDKWISFCEKNQLNAAIRGWNFFLPHLQKPVESDAVEFAEWLSNNTEIEYIGGYKYFYIHDGKMIGEETPLTELYSQFKQLNK